MDIKEYSENWQILFFIYKWQVVDLRMLKLRFSIPIKRNWTTFLNSKKDDIKTNQLWVRKNKESYKYKINIYTLTYSGFESVITKFELPYLKISNPLTNLEHNFTCLEIIQNYLKLNENDYYVNAGLFYKRENAWLTKNLSKDERSKLAPKRVYDFIYNSKNNNEIVACEVELHKKNKKRFYSTEPKNLGIFTKMNIDYANKHFNKLIYFVNEKLLEYMGAIFANAPQECQPKFPYDIIVIENILPDYEKRDKINHITFKIKSLLNKKNKENDMEKKIKNNKKEVKNQNNTTPKSINEVQKENLKNDKDNFLNIFINKKIYEVKEVAKKFNENGQEKEVISYQIKSPFNDNGVIYVNKLCCFDSEKYPNNINIGFLEHKKYIEYRTNEKNEKIKQEFTGKELVDKFNLLKEKSKEKYLQDIDDKNENKNEQEKNIKEQEKK